MGGSTTDLSNRSLNRLDEVGLKDFSNQFPTKLSGGQMQRVTIARSLINNPEIVFADEPTGDLDSVTGEQILKILKKLNQEHGTTIVMITHDPGLLGYADRVIHMQDGRIIEA